MFFWLQSLIRLKLTFLVIFFPCCILGLILIFIIFHAHDKINVEHIKSNVRSYLYLYPIGEVAQGRFHKRFHVCIDLTNSELKIN
jgi:hypothetical protein